MIEQKSNSIVFGAFYIASKVGVPGLTVTVDIFDPGGTKIINGVAATEIGEGLYRYTLSGASTGTEGEYTAIFKTAGAVDQQHIPAQWTVGRAGIEALDALISSRSSHTPGQIWDQALASHLSPSSTGAFLNAAGAASDPLLNPVPGDYGMGTAGRALGSIGSAQIITTSVISQVGNIEIVSGDSYTAAEGRAVDWMDTGNVWPDLTSATVVFKTGGLSFAMSIVTPTGVGKKVRLELSVAQSITISKKTASYTIEATIIEDHLTLAQAYISCK